MKARQAAPPSPFTWGLIPAAGAGSRIQPLACSKELLPVGHRREAGARGAERPRAVSEYLLERMKAGGAGRVCFVIGPGKMDIIQYYGREEFGPENLVFVLQPKPTGLCDALFRAVGLIRPDEQVLVGLPDTVWFPHNGFLSLPDGVFSFLLFPVGTPSLFDAVLFSEADGRVREIRVKQENAGSRWVWGAFKLPGSVFHALHRLWKERRERDEYFGTLVNAWLAAGGTAFGVPRGEIYLDVGTLQGYRRAIRLLCGARPPSGAMKRP